MQKRIIVLIISLCVASNSFAQNAEVKVNVLAGALTIFNPSIELDFRSQSALTIDYVGAYSRSDFLNTGSPFIYSMALFGYRHYLKRDCFEGFFFGGDFGLDVFRMDKNIVPFVANDNIEGKYDVGYGYVIGGTIGYKYNFARRWGVEASLSYGWHHAQHEGYNSDGEKMFDMNATAEWTPYKAGIYINYKLWE